MLTTHDHKLRLALACLLLGVYLLVYSPRVNSADGEAILNVTASTLRHGIPDIGAMGASEALLPFEMSRMGSFGLDGAYYSKKGVTPSIALAPLVVLSEALPWLDTRATAMLLNPLVTTLSALGLYTLARWLAYQPRAAFGLGLVYGLATFAIVYVKTLFGEPLAALLLLGAVMGVYRYRTMGDLRALALAGLCAGLMMGVNLAYIVLVPVIGLAAFLPFASTRFGQFIRAALAYALPVLTVLVVLGLYNWARFGSPLNTGYHFDSGEGFNKPLLEGLYGLTIGPYRGLFWYNPVLLLAIPGWLMLCRRGTWLAWFILALMVLGLLLFAAWWSWDGGIVWGPRFLLTITPLAALCLAPLIESAWKNRWLALVLLGFTGLSLVVQFLGAAYSIYLYISYLWEHYYDVSRSSLPDEVFWNPGLSAILGHLALALDRWPLEPAWAANGVDVLHLLAALALIIVAMLTIWWKRVALAVLVAAVAILVSLNVVVAQQRRGEEFEAVQTLQAALQPPGKVLVASTLFGESLVDVENGSWLLSTNAPTTLDDPLAAPMTDFAFADGGDVWLVTWFTPADPANWQEQALWERGAFAWEREAAGHRALLFSLTPTTPDQPGGYQFGVIRLENYGIQQTPTGLIVTVEWSASQPPAGDYQWFIHLLDAYGQIIAQQDRPPQGGYQPTSTWTQGETITDRLYFPGLQSEGTQLRIGWIDPVTGERLSTATPDGTPITDGFVVMDTNP
jgi:hypothetical protein